MILHEMSRQVKKKHTHTHKLIKLRNIEIYVRTVETIEDKT